MLINPGNLRGDRLLARFLRSIVVVVALRRIVPVQVALNHYLLVGQHDALPADVAGFIVIFPNHIRIRGQNRNLTVWLAAQTVIAIIDGLGSLHPTIIAQLRLEPQPRFAWW